MTYNARILADSIGTHGVRLTTIEATFPRFLLAEFNTHRMFSRNSASSRAIPTEKQIEKIRANPFTPVFNARVTGMGVGDPLSEDEQAHAQGIWLEQAESACKAAEQLLHVDKSRANRLLEPFSWHKVLVSSTEYWNFFNLRDSPEAQPEMQEIASQMKTVYNQSHPTLLEVGQWHLPLVYEKDYRSVDDLTDLPSVSAGRCARVSYERHTDDEPARVSQGRWEKLWPKAHWSPGEHPAQVLRYADRVNNYVGFKQLRAFYPNEAVFQG